MTPRPPGPADPDAFAALEEQRDHLLTSLDDLEREHDAGDLDDADYEALRDDYTARAAEVLRALEAGEARFAETRARPAWTRVAALAVAVLLFGGAAGFLVARASGNRSGNDTITGDIRLSTRDRLVEAQSLLAQGEAVGALEVYDEILVTQPDNVEALTYRGWTVAQAQLFPEALASLDRALEIDPDYADARLFRAIVRDRSGDAEGAAADLDQLDVEALPADVRPLVDAFRDRVGGDQ